MLDWICTYGFWIPFVVGGGAFLVLALYVETRSRLAEVAIVSLATLAPLALMVWAFLAGYGYLHHDSITYLGAHGKYLTIKDTTDGRLGRFSRVYWIDLNNGDVLLKRRFRSKIELSYSDAFVYLETDDALDVHDVETGRALAHFPERSFGSLLPSGGSTLHAANFDPKTLNVTVINKRGESFIYPFNTLFPKATPAVASEDDFREHAAAQSSKQVLSRSKAFRLEGSDRKELLDAAGRAFKPRRTFIGVESVETYSLDAALTSEITVIQSYESLEKDAFVLSVLDGRSELLWQFRGGQTSLHCGSSVGATFLHAGKLLVLVSNCLFSFNAVSGDRNWQRRI
ncbi:MAG: hypothetical protein AAFQ77_01690 [Myxococcota bacterium]